jgi:hypothetical protein
LALTKYWCRQNIGVDKILASTESRHQQYFGPCAEASPYCFGPAKSAAADFSQASLMFSYFHVQSPNVLLLLAALLLWADSLLHCVGIFVSARHAENVTNIGVNKISEPTKISLIFAKLQQSISLLTGVLSKIGKSKKQLPSLSSISFCTHNLCSARTGTGIGLLEEIPRSGVQIPCLYLMGHYRCKRTLCYHAQTPV